MQPKELQILTLLFILIRFHVSEGQQHLNCSSLFSCGKTIHGVGYPFWGGDRPPECGLRHLELSCRRYNCTTIDIDGEVFVVRNIKNHNNSMRIARIELLSDVCLEKIQWSNSLFRYTPNVEILTLFSNCSSFNTSSRNNFNCKINGTDRLGFIEDESLTAVQIPNRTAACEMNVTIPVLKSAREEFRRNNTKALKEVLDEGFEVEYQTDVGGGACAECESSGGTGSCCFISLDLVSIDPYLADNFF